MRPVTLITSDASGGAQASSPHAPDRYISPFNVTLKAIVTGTVDYDVQYTSDLVLEPGYNPATGDWTPITGMDGATASAEETIISPVNGIRLLQNSGTGSVRLIITQAG